MHRPLNGNQPASRIRYSGVAGWASIGIKGSTRVGGLKDKKF